MKVKDYLERVIKQEGNEKEFVYQGYECMILRVEGLGHLCGYVRIPYNSPLKDLGYDVDFDVHGGITYNGTFKHKGKEGHWIGFDTAHCMDLSLYQLEKGYATDNLFYRDMNYVTLEIQKLVHQIKNWR